jgi:TonB family protein
MMALHGQGWMVHALGWTLLHFCWQGAAVAGMLWCLLALIGGRASAMRYGAACGALGLMVAAPLVTFAKLAVEARRAGLAGTMPAIDWMITVMPGAGGGDGLWMERIAYGLDRAAPWLPMVWIVGVLLFLARLNIGLMVARGMKTDGIEAVPGDLTERFEGLKTRLGIRRVVGLVRSARVQVPTVIGWMRPVVLMPAACLAGLSTGQVEALLVHELAHIRRNDYLMNVLQTVVEAVLFYHPAVWWVSKQVRLERECRCDQMAAEVGGDALGYAKALSLLETRRAFSLSQDVVLGANGGVLTMRIKRLLGYRESSVVSQGVAMVLLAGAMAAPGMYWATAARASVAHGRASAAVELVSSPASGLVMPVEGLRAVGLVARVELPSATVAQEAKRVSGGVMAGQLVSRVDPVYPPDAKSARISGAVVLDAVIGKEGTIENLRVVSGPEELQKSAIDAVRQWVYKPYLLNGEPTEVETTITVNYSFEDRSEGGAGESLIPGVHILPRPPVVADGVMAGQLVSRPNPIYPKEAKEERIQGAVVLRAIISKEGRIENLSVLSGPEKLRHSAIDAVRQWVYKPYLLNGEPTEVETTITVNYSFDGMSMVPRAIGNGVSAPVAVSMADPEYTKEARKDKVSGVVKVNFWVDEKGVPTHVRVVRGIGHGLDEKAIEAVSKYRFTPAMENGKPVTVAMNVEVDFQMF